MTNIQSSPSKKRPRSAPTSPAGDDVRITRIKRNPQGRIAEGSTPPMESVPLSLWLPTEIRNGISELDSDFEEFINKLNPETNELSSKYKEMKEKLVTTLKQHDLVDQKYLLTITDALKEYCTYALVLENNRRVIGNQIERITSNIDELRYPSVLNFYRSFFSEDSLRLSTPEEGTFRFNVREYIVPVLCKNASDKSKNECALEEFILSFKQSDSACKNQYYLNNFLKSKNKPFIIKAFLDAKNPEEYKYLQKYGLDILNKDQINFNIKEVFLAIARHDNYSKALKGKFRNFIDTDKAKLNKFFKDNKKSFRQLLDVQNGVEIFIEVVQNILKSPRQAKYFVPELNENNILPNGLEANWWQSATVEQIQEAMQPKQTLQDLTGDRQGIHTEEANMLASSVIEKFFPKETRVNDRDSFRQHFSAGVDKIKQLARQVLVRKQKQGATQEDFTNFRRNYIKACLYASYSSTFRLTAREPITSPTSLKYVEIFPRIMDMLADEDISHIPFTPEFKEKLDADKDNAILDFAELMIGAYADCYHIGRRINMIRIDNIDYSVFEGDCGRGLVNRIAMHISPVLEMDAVLPEINKFNKKFIDILQKYVDNLDNYGRGLIEDLAFIFNNNPLMLFYENNSKHLLEELTKEFPAFSTQPDKLVKYVDNFVKNELSGLEIDLSPKIENKFEEQHEFLVEELYSLADNEQLRQNVVAALHKQGIEPDAIKSAQELLDIPIVKREMYQKLYNNYNSMGHLEVDNAIDSFIKSTEAAPIKDISKSKFEKKFSELINLAARNIRTGKNMAGENDDNVRDNTLKQIFPNRTGQQKVTAEMLYSNSNVQQYITSEMRRNFNESADIGYLADFFADQEGLSLILRSTDIIDISRLKRN